LNCNTNSSKNLRLIDGTLAITVIREKYLNKEYTSAQITTREGFTFGRFEIRAALPEGKMLRPGIYMNPEKFDGWAKNGKIDIMTNIEDNKFGAGIHFGRNPALFEGNRSANFSVFSNLNDFHTYSIEWNESEIKWFFDDINHLTININRSLNSLYSGVGQPFDKPFRLQIHLGIGGQDRSSDFISNEILSLEDVINWKCSLLIIDYVRIYKWERIDKWQNGSLIFNSSPNDVSADKICQEVMPLITPSKNASNEKTSTTPTPVMIVSTISSFLLLVLISIIVSLLIRQRNLKRINDSNNIDYYDDFSYPETYDVINTDICTEPYQELAQCCVVSEGIEIYEEMADQKKDRNSDPQYLTMTNR